MSKGKVYLVGAGPGDPKLMTVYGLECIQKADVIIYDRLVNQDLLQYAKNEAQLIYAGKEPGKHDNIQEQIHQWLVEKALQGKMVVRLKGGDPFVFGRGGEEAEVLVKHGIPFEVIPGITAGIAAAAYAGIPVTYRHLATSFTIVTGHVRSKHGADSLNWRALADGSDTIAFYMGIGNLPYICQQLIQHGKDPETKVAIIEWGTTMRQRTVVGTLQNIAEKAEGAGISHPAIILVGEVVKLRETIQWFPELEGEIVDTK
ncbi:uroporphyrinogen-III C-methyltransferase [Anoxybacillus sp. B7M1]|uniref:Uroporphyrinogen-III C-methyltransferase n=1 Tax=Anoxybacteroides rupiense TaxID=311460 RepID=A0ABD5ITA5_9BACL|nr:MULTISPECIES: uroporphyrinogen-III C-methyltransferase [Anoxybacillus]ANB58911.1 uroporphyrinogen-III C-methyltransferase [Anoxybacillus sp. B2M1]ANB63978.1 uroporphyrinogen-III C-methyltransferase [Anoxybacillus sp. B7M1]KXG09235.1 Uroporphyrinogen-III C-methyltransferase [Anoxybacillus sp. P3H1B]MBB3905810.1 uroporphyrin-III C-methyltransferase [Anoxybacillus rupiensis]MBS2772385.1 uroporphyrinogen-III C-methyltransferase [Anoxybacillus rupiensis]